MRLAAAFLTFAALACVPSASAQPPEIDNPWVKVTRLRIAAHAVRVARHWDDAVVVYLTDAPQHKAGDVVWLPAGKRSESNLSDKALQLAVVELKPPPAGPVQPRVTLDPVKLDPTHHLVVFENDRVRVIHTILEPHVKSPMHEHPHYVVAYITELHTTMVLPDGKKVDNPRRPAELDWRDFMKHQTENIGDRTAVEIQIEVK